MDLTLEKLLSRVGGNNSNSVIIPLFICFIGGALRIIVAVFVTGDRFIWPDEINDYYPAALRLFEGKGWGSKTNIMPFFPYVLSIYFHLGDGDILWTRIILACLNSSMMPCVYFLTRHIFGKTSALCAMFIVACYPILIFSSVLILPETFFTLLVVLGILSFSLACTKPSFLWLSALLFGLANFTISILSPFIILAFFIVMYILRHESLIKRVTKTVLFMLIFYSTVCLWGIRNYFVLGEFLTTKSNVGKVLYMHNNEFSSGFNRKENFLQFTNNILPRIEEELKDENDLAKNRIFTAKSTDFIRSHPLQFLVLCLERFLNLWRFYPEETISESSFTASPFKVMSIVTYGPILLLALVGLIRARKMFRSHLVIWGYCISLVFIFTLIRSSMRARLPLEPFLALYAGAGMTYVWRYFQAHFLKTKGNQVQL